MTKKENNSDRNGRALETMICERLCHNNFFKLTTHANQLNLRDKQKVLDLPPQLRERFDASVEKIVKWVDLEFAEETNVSIDRLADSSIGPTDIVIASDLKVLALSVKHNHFALKHSRPFSFAQACGFEKNSANDLSFRALLEVDSDNFRKINRFKKNFDDAEINSKEKLYLDISKNCSDFVNLSQIKYPELARKLFSFFVGVGFLKVVVESKKNKVTVHDYLNFTEPTLVLANLDSYNSFNLQFNNGWVINLRVHTASKKISSPKSQLSLKFDVQKVVGKVKEIEL